MFYGRRAQVRRRMDVLQVFVMLLLVHHVRRMIGEVNWRFVQRSVVNGGIVFVAERMIRLYPV